LIQIGDRVHEVASATLEIFHLFAEEAGWTFEAVLGGTSGRVALEGRVRMPALPGPSVLMVSYLDAPRVVTLDGAHGSLTPGATAGLSCVALDVARVRIEGTLQLVWTALASSSPATRVVPITIGVDAALIT
jgi:hypothetical protein